MYNARRKVIPTVPKSLDESQQYLLSCQNDILIDGKKFCFLKSEGAVPLFTTSENLRVLVQAEHVIADGTFTYAPKFYYQLYTVHVYSNGFHIPVVFALLNGKSKENYLQFWNTLKELCLFTCHRELKVKFLHVDFEKAAHVAALEVFPGCVILGCTFHLHQAWFRRIQKNKSLLKAYRAKDDVGKWLKLFFGLSFFPPDLVQNAFLSLMATAPNELNSFTYYVHTTYIEDDASFPPTMWAASPPDSHLTTTNGAESYHSDYNKQFYTPHPNIHLVLTAFKEIQMETNMKIESWKRGAVNKLRKAAADNLQFLLQCWDTYLEEKDEMAYMTNIANRCNLPK